MILALIVFLSVTFGFTAKNGFSYDKAVGDWVSATSTKAIVKVMDIISLFGSSEVILIITFVIAALFAVKRNWIFTFFFLTVSVGGVVVNFVLKILFQRERPGEMSYIEVFNYSFEIPSYSFPSGHTMRATILLLFLIYMSAHFIKGGLRKTISILACMIMMVGVALSRLFLDAHFLSDTLGAISISIVWFCMCLLFFRKYQAKKTQVLYPRW